MKIVNDVTELIGETPLIKLSKVLNAGTNTVLAKLEQLNPGGSVKDRAALSMINEAEKRGVITSGTTIIEATSGNTGIALAMIAAARGYDLLIVMPEVMSRERREALKLFGAEVELSPTHLGMEGAVELAQKFHEKIQNSFLVSQFDNPANVEAHFRTTAKEILRDTEGKVDIVIAGSGTGGTITGVGKRLKEVNPEIKVIAVEPEASPVLTGGECGPHMIQGIGPGFVPSIFDRSVIDEILPVSDKDAFEATRSLIASEGILAGISSGAVLSAARSYLTRNNLQDMMVVLIFPDTGERNLSLLVRNMEVAQVESCPSDSS